MILHPYSSSIVNSDVKRYYQIIKNAGGDTSNIDWDNIHKFVSGLYSIIGRIDFWMLRQNQNIGNGDKVYSFHGLMGDLINGPSWSLNGLVGEGNREYVSIPIKRTNIQNRSAGFIVEVHTYAQADSFLGSNNMWHGFGGTQGIFIGGACSHGKQGSGNYTNITLNANVVRSWFFALTTFDNNGESKAFRNGSLVGSNTSANAVGYNDSSNIRLMSGVSSWVGDTNGIDGTMSFAFETLKTLSNTQVALFHKIYKETIGQGLGLP